VIPAPAAEMVERSWDSHWPLFSGTCVPRRVTPPIAAASPVCLGIHYYAQHRHGLAAIAMGHTTPHILTKIQSILLQPL
jgi:hypothetical protein